MNIHYLSKSKMLSGLQCPKRLYLEVHHPELIEESADLQRRFTIGHLVGEMAQKLVPDGILIEYDGGLSQALKETRHILESSPDTPIFEATFSHGGVLVRTDIFYKGDNGYRLVEVKNSTSVKDYHIPDCAVQAWVIESLGYPLERVELAHIDNTFVYQGDGDYQGLFHHEDVTNEILPLKEKVPGLAKNFQSMLSGDLPDIDVGDHCNDPFECPFVNHCYPEPHEYPVSILPRGGKVVDELLDEGIEDIRDIPEGRLTNLKHEKVRRVTVNGKPEIDPEISTYLKDLSYPRYYLDFEALMTPIPIWPGTRPYQTHLPYQWSCHIEEQLGELRHEEYLDVTEENPMRPLAEKLMSILGDKGPIFVYSSFENTVLNRLGEFFPDLLSKLNKIKNRLVDLLPLAREYYYHPEMKGSWSIKSVLPTVAPKLNYSDLEEVQKGMGAQMAYLEAINPETSESRREELIERLLEYCKMDTLAMVKLVGYFQKKM